MTSYLYLLAGGSYEQIKQDEIGIDGDSITWILATRQASRASCADGASIVACNFHLVLRRVATRAYSVQLWCKVVVHSRSLESKL